MSGDVTVRVAQPEQLDVPTLYALLRLRIDVFVVEQKCPYPDLDGLDLEPDTLHMWLENGGRPVAYLRIVPEGEDTMRIGRVVVPATQRRAGLAARLVQEALARVGHLRCVLNSQTTVTGLYRRFGFSPTGPEFLEDGIPHVPMARPPSAR